MDEDEDLLPDDYFDDEAFAESMAELEETESEEETA